MGSQRVTPAARYRTSPGGRCLALRTAARRSWGLLRSLRPLSGTRRLRELLPLRVLDQQREGSVEDRHEVAVRNLVAKQRLRIKKLVVARLAARELDLVALAAQRFRRRTRCAQLRRRRSRDAASSGLGLGRGPGGLRRQPESGGPPGIGKLPDLWRYVWLRSAVCQEHLDRTLALVTRSLEQLLVVLRGEHGGEQAQSSNMELPFPNPLEHDGIGARGARSVDAVTGLRLREVEYRRAVAEHGRAALFEVELAVINLCDVREEIRLVVAALSNELVESAEQPVVSDGLE